MKNEGKEEKGGLALMIAGAKPPKEGEALGPSQFEEGSDPMEDLAGDLASDIMEAMESKDSDLLKAAIKNILSAAGA